MKYRSLKKAVLVTALSAVIFGCSGPDKGHDSSFTAQEQVRFLTVAILSSMSEESGMQSVDLLEDAVADGEPLEGPVYIRNLSFEAADPAFQTPGAGTPDGSPFRLNGTNLDVDTDAFAEALRMCDTTDVRGATDATGAPIGDGVRDFPQSIDYEVTFIVDNGYEFPPGNPHPTRTLNLTVNAMDDPVTDVQAFDLSVAAGDTVPMPSATAPSYACNPALTYEIADTNIATVDVDGNVTGEARGDTTITVTSVENPALFATANLTVTPGFNIEITNQDYNVLGAPLGTKTVPSCSAIGLNLEPSIVADTLAGAYTYNWSSDNPSAAFAASEFDGAFGATGRFTNALGVAEMATITASFGTGYTGATDAADVLDQQVVVTAERNLACDPGLNVNGGGFLVDLLLDGNVGPGWGPNVSFVNPGLDGTALQINAPGGDILNVVQQRWNQVDNFHAATYGRGAASIGRTFKFSVWARVNQLPSAGDVTLEHTLLAWNCDGCVDPGFPGRRPLAGSVGFTLKPTTDWQLVEFINPLTGNNEWTVPDHWNVNTAVFLFWDVYGLAAGESIQLDNYSIVEVPTP